MPNRGKETEPNPIDPELTVSQKAIKDLADRVLSHKPRKLITNSWSLESRISLDGFQSRLRESGFGDTVLKNGDTLSASEIDGHHPDLGLIVGKAELYAAGITALEWRDNKWRIDPDGSQHPPYNIIRCPGEFDWARQLDIWLAYKDGGQTAWQAITVYTSSRSAGLVPSISRSVNSVAYFETGYEGHNRIHRDDFSEETVMEFISLAEELYNSRIAI